MPKLLPPQKKNLVAEVVLGGENPANLGVGAGVRIYDFTWKYFLHLVDSYVNAGK